MIEGLGAHASTAEGQGARVQSLVRELKCHILLEVAKKKNTMETPWMPWSGMNKESDRR